MNDIESLGRRIGHDLNYRTYEMDDLAPISGAWEAPPVATPPVQPPPRQAFGPVSAPLVTTPTPALAFNQYAERPAGSLAGGVLLVDLFKRLEAHAR